MCFFLFTPHCLKCYSAQKSSGVEEDATKLCCAATGGGSPGCNVWCTYANYRRGARPVPLARYDTQHRTEKALKSSQHGRRTRDFWSESAGEAERLHEESWHARSVKEVAAQSWIQKGESPQTKFMEYNWKGLSEEEIKAHKMYPRFEGFEDAWMKTQHKKGTILTVDAYLKSVNEQAGKKPRAKVQKRS
ncbi:unnamed protein product [Phytophthora fragariaefolia]|uniref:Unnamed protein product n=1 Tax=Phytophthora fragariaefolia TaxID=1490495 RepID=A0A9W6X8Z5_9STRA|nr:unnamed protein product [Phytophthora fragariaefolia]